MIEESQRGESHPGESHPDELAALYASGAMSADERRQFEAHVEEGCAACRAELAEYVDTLAALLRAVEPQAPPPASWAGLQARLEVDSLAQHLNHGHLPGDRASHADNGRAHDDASDHLPEGVRVIKADPAAWCPTQYAGVELRVLYVDKPRRQYTALVRMAPGAVYPAHAHEGAEECLVLEGDLRFGDQVLSRGDYLRTGPGYEQTTQTTEQGCLLYLSTPFE